MKDRADLLVLGATGFVGSAIVREAKVRGLSVLEIGRANYQPGLSARWLINANGNSKKYLAREQPAHEFDLSVRSTMRSLHDFNFERYCFLSSIDVYDNVCDPANNGEDAVIQRDKLSPYGLHKLMAEDLVRHYAPHWLILRMGGFIGPGLRKNSIYDLLKGVPLRVHPDSRYQYQHTQSLAAIALDLLAGGAEREVWNVAGAGVISVREIAEWIPNAQLPPLIGTPERYEINIARLQARREVASTRDTVRQFVEDVLAGRER
ncbi:MAG: NAD-dependent epimerase/dehydratase family protein [Kiritimatiellae bacterium]|nr:NAD-dependent epimerase/dehydratase family protein [Kiritimatiellia bacterium]